MMDGGDSDDKKAIGIDEQVVPLNFRDCRPSISNAYTVFLNVIIDYVYLKFKFKLRCEL